jgi:hypothetical protein
MVRGVLSLLALLLCFIVLFSDSAGISAIISNAALQMSSPSLYGTMENATIPLFTTNIGAVRILNIATSLKCGNQ